MFIASVKNVKDKNIILDTFSESKWKSFTDESKTNLKIAKAALKSKYSKMCWQMFPSECLFLRKKADEVGLVKKKVFRDILQKTL